MRVRAVSLAILLLSTPALAVGDAAARGVAAFQSRKWSETMSAFLDVLRADPANAEAHAYMTLAAREMEAERQTIVRDHRLEMLNDAAKRVESNHQDAAPIAQAIEETGHAEEHAKEDKWKARCDEARVERESGHLLNAHTIVLEVLAENPAMPEAQRELSELQSQVRRILDSGSGASILERYTLQGFYSYGQADYPAALAAWSKVRTLQSEIDPSAAGAKRLEELRFLPYQTIAQRHVDDANGQAELKNLFHEGVTLYAQKHFTRALVQFRRVAIKDPDYPELGYYLVQAEAGSENERALRLGERKRREVELALQDGLTALDQEKFQDAQADFEKVVLLDPSHPQARAYLAMATAEMKKRHDPKAAQMHYETGLVAYASGKLEESAREWRIATRMNPQLVRAANALAKVQKELALSHGSDIADETIP